MIAVLGGQGGRPGAGGTSLTNSVQSKEIIFNNAMPRIARLTPPRGIPHPFTTGLSGKDGSGPNHDVSLQQKKLPSVQEDLSDRTAATRCQTSSSFIKCDIEFFKGVPLPP